jgi:ketosteroid isomerase-like protein
VAPPGEWVVRGRFREGALTGTARGQHYDNRAIYLMRLRDGRYTELRTLDTDREDITRFWTAVGVPATA